MTRSPGSVIRWTSFLRAVVISSALGLAISTEAAAADAGIKLGLPPAPSIDEGEVLLGELNCIACHAAPENIARRLNSRAAPKLDGDGLHWNRNWVKQWLVNPAASKPGTTMPRLLHGEDTTTSESVAEDLAHFLTSVGPSHTVNSVSADPSRVETGRALYHTVGCVACHAPEKAEENVTESALKTVRDQSVPLGNLAAKYPAGELVRFLLNPQRHRPAGRMPGFRLTESEAASLATYLLRDQLAEAAKTTAAPVGGLKWEYFEAHFGGCADFDKLQPVLTGSTDVLSTRMAKRGEQFGIRFSGVLDVPADGDYTFWINSDDGSQLFLDGARLINNDGDHPPAQKSGKATLKSGPHSFTVLFYQNGGGHEFSVRWAGPGFNRREIPTAALKHFAQPLVPVGWTEPKRDPAREAKGREHFQNLNCAACHAVAGITAKSSKPLLELANAAAQGCLSESGSSKSPRFDLSPAQRKSLQTTVSKIGQLGEPLPSAQSVAKTFAQLQCQSCHARGGHGGPLNSGRSDWFKLVGEADLGDEGRIPPHLDHVGMKLKPGWLERVVSEGAKVRPYMATRMPQFGATHAKHIREALAAADQRPDAQPEPAKNERDAKYGWKLVGRDGLNCIACHTFTTYGSLGIPALGLDAMGERIQWDWFRRYLPDPASLRPGTRMPTFWPEGRAVNTAILGGHTENQVKAIWAWLAAGPKAELPSGLIRGRKEVVADKEAVIYRNFIAGAGSRAIGVGYPEKANLAFDANDLALAMIWQGSFIDASRHSSDRGVGFEPPLGDHVLMLPPAPAFAALANDSAAWPKPPDRLVGANRFLGYRLDPQQRPTFRYRVGDVTVEETPTPKPGDVDMTLSRRFVLSGSGQLWMRIAVGRVESIGGKAYSVDGKWKVEVRGGGQPIVVGNELRVPVNAPGEFSVDMTW